MKPTASLLSFLAFLLFALVTIAETRVVFDSDGHMLRNGDTVYLSPVTSGGGIISAAIKHNGGSDSCSLAVISDLQTNGWPVRIWRFTKDLRPISTVESWFIDFTYVPPNICTNSGSWTVIRSSTFGDSVMLWGAQDSGATHVSGKFYIRTVDILKRHYKLEFCEEGKHQCGNIGVQIDGTGLRRLVVTDEEPLVFMFESVHHKENFNFDLSMVV